MVIIVKKIFLGYLGIWMRSIRLVFTAWCVTIGVFWSITLGSIIELTNNDKPNVGTREKNNNKYNESLNTSNPNAINDHCNVISRNSNTNMCHSYSRHPDKNSKRLPKIDDTFSRCYIPTLRIR